MVEQIVIILHLFIAIAVIGLILIQQGKGADAGASFGSGASQTIFGSQGSGNFLTKTTSWLAFAFFATSFGLAIIAKDKAGALVDVDIPQVEQTETTVSESATKDSDVPNTEAQPGSVKGASDTELPVVEEEQK
jgi:preprotein translocase subunit SecG